MQESGAFQLAMGQGPQPGQVFELPQGTISIGRDPGNQVMIDDVQVSRQHARLIPQGGLMVLEDLGSTNGTSVNGLRITSPHTLAHGDEIGLGDNVTLIFYGRPAGGAGETVMAPRVAYDSPPSAAPAYPPPAFEAPPAPAHQPPPADYAAAPDHAAQPEEYEDDYEEAAGCNWALIGGCLLVAIITVLLLAVIVYFLAPASVVDPIGEFLEGLGVNVP